MVRKLEPPGSRRCCSLGTLIAGRAVVVYGCAICRCADRLDCAARHRVDPDPYMSSGRRPLRTFVSCLAILRPCGFRRSVRKVMLPIPYLTPSWGSYGVMHYGIWRAARALLDSVGRGADDRSPDLHAASDDTKGLITIHGNHLEPIPR